jgi:hypothetical protein
MAAPEKRMLKTSILLLLSLVLGPGPALARWITLDMDIANSGPQKLVLSIPPASDTTSGLGVTFDVDHSRTRNLYISAGSNAYMYVPGEGYMGKAVQYDAQGNEVAAIGYKLQLWIDYGNGTATQTMSSTQPAGTPTIYLYTDNNLDGRIDIWADPAWTADGKMPAPGLYQATVTLTVTAVH